MRQHKEPPTRDNCPRSHWLAWTILAAYALGLLILLGFCLSTTGSFLASLPPARPEFDPLVLVFPGAIEVEELSHTSIYVGNCCTARQLAYYTPKPMSEVRVFYESKLEQTFTSGSGFPPHPNFEDYGHYSSCMAVFFCRPDCETPDHTTQSISLADATELLTEAGTVIILQIHEETYWYERADYTPGAPATESR